MSAPPLTDNHLNIEDIFLSLEQGQISVNDAMDYLRKTPTCKAQGLNEQDNKLEIPDIETILQELDALIGIQRVKKLVKELYAFVQVQQRRREQALIVEPLVLHMIFKGNPGTGKTTVARLLGQILHNLRVLPKGHLIEVERADMVGEYIGHTAQKTREQIKLAMGGILFVDEAYALGRGGSKDFGKEAIDAMVKAMEDHKDKFILILAGYQKEMEAFIELNPGLRSRFPIHVEFEDFSLPELLDIARLMLKKRDYYLSDTAFNHLETVLSEKRQKLRKNFGNARLVRNMIEEAIRHQAVRLVKAENNTRTELMTIEVEDLPSKDGERL